MQIWRNAIGWDCQGQLTFDDSQIGLHIHHLLKWIAFISPCLMRSKIIYLASMFSKIDEYIQNKSGNYSVLWRSRHFQCPILEFE
jgi:hypothetical protein